MYSVSRSFFSTTPLLVNRLPIGAARASLRTGPLKRRSSELQFRKSADMEYKIGVAGPGAGSALFMMRMVQKLTNPLLALSTKNQVSFSFVQVGDSANSYVSLPTDSFQSLTKSAIKYLGKQKGCNIIVLGNAASVFYDRSMKEWADKVLPGKNVVSLVRPTATHLYSKAQFVSVGGTLEKRIGILGTPTTTASHQYPEALAKFHAADLGSSGIDSITVVVNRDSRFPGPQVYRGGNSLARGSDDELRVLAAVANHDIATPVLFVHVYCHNDWNLLVENTEGMHVTGAVRKAGLHDNLAGFFKQSPLEEIRRMSVLGLACTEYPLLKSEIIDILHEMQLPGIEVIGQAAAVAESSVLPIITQDIALGRIDPREAPLSINQVRITMSSWTTANDYDPGVNSFLRVQNLCNSFNPQMAKLIEFFKIPPFRL